MNVRICDICRKAAAKYVCQRCGSLICEDHYNPFLYLCNNCAEEESIKKKYYISPVSEPLSRFFLIPAIWIIAIMLITIGTLLFFGLGLESEGGVIIFPIPLIIPINPIIGIIFLFILIFIFLIIIMYFTSRLFTSG